MTDINFRIVNTEKKEVVRTDNDKLKDMVLYWYNSVYTTALAAATPVAVANAVAAATVDLNSWDVSWCTDMSSMFEGLPAFNVDLKWDFSHVTNMERMFLGCKKFNKPVVSGTPATSTTLWNTSNVTNMSGMFSGCTSLNNTMRLITDKVTDMSDMFSGCIAFNSSVDTVQAVPPATQTYWDTSKVTDMSNMFSGCTTFNQDFKNWVTNKVTNMSNMFNGAIKFDGKVESWHTSNVINMSSMFRDAKVFDNIVNFTNNYPTAWNVGKVKNMSYMFYNAEKFVAKKGGVGLDNPDWSSNLNKDVHLTNMFINNAPSSVHPSWYA